MTSTPGSLPIDQVLATMAPTRLRQVIDDLASHEPAGDVGLRLDAVIAALLDGSSLGDGADGWRATIRLKQAIAEMVSGMDGLRYVEGDA